jgi:hypothetical protein
MYQELKKLVWWEVEKLLLINFPFL